MHRFSLSADPCVILTGTNQCRLKLSRNSQATPLVYKHLTLTHFSSFMSFTMHSSTLHYRAHTTPHYMILYRELNKEVYKKAKQHQVIIQPFQDHHQHLVILHGSSNVGKNPQPEINIFTKINRGSLTEKLKKRNKLKLEFL